MRRAILITLTGLILAGCLEKVDPMSNINGFAAPGSVTLSWQPPTENADGSPLRDLSGYKIYVGTDSNAYDYREILIDNPGLTTFVVNDLEPGVYYIAATALNSSGMESSFSAEVVRTVN